MKIWSWIAGALYVMEFGPKAAAVQDGPGQAAERLQFTDGVSFEVHPAPGDGMPPLWTDVLPAQAAEKGSVSFEVHPAAGDGMPPLWTEVHQAAVPHEWTGPVSGSSSPGFDDETRSAEKEAAKPRFGGSASSKGPRWRDGSIEKPVGTRTNAGGWSEAYYTVEQQRRLGVDETGKPIQEEGEAEDHCEVEEGEAEDDSEVTRRYPGIPRAIKLDKVDAAHPGIPSAIKLDGVDNPCVKGVYYRTLEMFNDQPMWMRRDLCYGYTWIARAAAIDWRSFEDGRHEMEFGFVDHGGLQHWSGVHFERVLVSRWKQ